MASLPIGPLNFTPALVIFDKDGTLIDFNHMWGKWITTLARRLESVTQLELAERLYPVMGYDPQRGRVIQGEPLAMCSMATLRGMTVDVAWRAGLSRIEAERATAAAWFIPDPVTLAKPLADLPRVFSTLRARGILTAVATSDDREPTAATLSALGVTPYLNALVSADEGLPNKPAPDMLLHVCRTLNVSPAHAAMVGDAAADMVAARAAGIGLCVGVLSGLAQRENLAPFADTIIRSVDEII